MARKTENFTIDDENSRDNGKTFLITEMPARRAEEWAYKALLAVAHSGVDVPDNVLEAGMSALPYMCIQALEGIKFDEAKPLLDEMMTCVQIKEKAVTRSLTNDDIEEVRTLVLLRGKVLELHVGFSVAAVL